MKKNRNKKHGSLLVSAAVLLVFTVMAGILPSFALISVKAAAHSGKCGDGLTWSLEDGVLTVSGSGDMYDYTTDSTEPGSPWFEYRDEINALMIESGVTSVGGSAFYRCSSLSQASLPDSVSYVGNYAFGNTAIIKDGSKYEDGVLYIGNHLIKANAGLLPSSYAVKRGTVTIAGGAFASCTGLTEITIPDTVAAVCDYAFYFCPAIKKLTVPGSVTVIHERAFGDCAGIETLELKEGVRTVGAYSFSSCLRIKELTLPVSVRTVGESSFCNCTGLETIDFGGGLAEIGGSAFYNCTSLSSVTIPGNVRSIGDGAFFGCFCIESANIESGVKSIGSYAFYECSMLESVSIPNSVREIGFDAFGGCYGVCVSCGNESRALGYAKENGINYSIISEPVVLKSGKCGDGLTWSFDDNGKMMISGSGKMDDFLYASDAPWYLEKDDISSVVISEGVTTVSDWAFSFCYGIKKITVPDSVESIGYKTFCGCGIKEAGISQNLRSLGSFAFACRDIERFTVDERNGYFSSDDRGALLNKDKTVLIQYPLGSKEWEYSVPDTVVTIGSWAFESCACLETVVIPGSVRTINYRAFSSCPLLSQVIMSNGVFEIGDVAFFDCKNLYTVTLPDSVASVGFASFGYYSDNGNKMIDGFTIRCFEGSAAMRYAVENGIDIELFENGIVISDASVYKKCGEFLCGTAADTPLDSFASGFVSDITVKDANGAEITSGKICTGHTVSSRNETLTVIVSGDTNGDGESDSSDAALVLRYDSGLKELDEANRRAGDQNGDGETDSLDASLILKADAG